MDGGGQANRRINPNALRSASKPNGGLSAEWKTLAGTAHGERPTG
jgi:hypothetical protein